MGGSAVRKARVLILGVTNAGKTAMIYKLQGGNSLSAIGSTVGIDLQNVRFGDFRLMTFDFGYQRRVVPMYRPLLWSAEGIIYVVKKLAAWQHGRMELLVDSSDKRLLPMAKEELEMILDFDELKNKPLLVAANKQDEKGALTARQIVENMDLSNITDREWHVHNVSVKTGEGLDGAMAQFIMMLEEFKSRNTPL